MTTSHAQLLAAALRNDDDAVRAGIAHLDYDTTIRLRLACVLISQEAWDHETNIHAERWRARLQGEAA